LGYKDGKEILKEHIAKTAALTDEQFDYFFSHFKQLSCKKGQIVIREGDKVDSEYFVLSGCLKAFFIKAVID
jgi:CRP-like cAMP-binding protein